MKILQSLLALFLLAMFAGCDTPKKYSWQIEDEDVREKSETTEAASERNSPFGLDGRGKAPIVGYSVRSLCVWQLPQMLERPDYWEDFSEIMNVKPVTEALEDLFRDLAEQNVSVVYAIRNENGVYFAVDVNSCGRKQKVEVEGILEDFCKSLNEQDDFEMKFYRTDKGFYYVGPDDTWFEDSVEHAELGSWRKAMYWDTLQQSCDEPFSLFSLNLSVHIPVRNMFPSFFDVPSYLRSGSKFGKYAESFVKPGSRPYPCRFLCISACGDPQKCVYIHRVTLDSPENAQRVQQFFTDYMSDLADTLDDKKVVRFLKSQKPKIEGNSVVWEYDASWIKENRNVIDAFLDIMGREVVWTAEKFDHFDKDSTVKENGGDPGKSPLIDRETQTIMTWRLAEIDDRSYSRSWDDFAVFLKLPPIVESGMEDLFEGLANQNVSVMYAISGKKRKYFAFDVSSCDSREKEGVVKILKEFCKNSPLNDFKFYDTERGFYFIGPDDPEFGEAVRNARFQSWEKEGLWGVVQQSFNKPFFAARLGVKDTGMAIREIFPPYFWQTAYSIRNHSKLKKYVKTLGSEESVEFETRSILGFSISADPQKCVLLIRVTLDSRENAQKVQDLFTEYMADLAEVLGNQKVADFLNSQKCKIVGNSVVWKYDASWMKANREAMEAFEKAVEDYSDQME